jgi:hypothetical protein
MNGPDAEAWVGEAYARQHAFEQIAVNVDEWTSLHRCPATGELWKKYFPFPEMHGGGPARFERISTSDAERNSRHVCSERRAGRAARSGAEKAR